jgi:hypothetical protein
MRNDCGNRSATSPRSQSTAARIRQPFNVRDFPRKLRLQEQPVALHSNAGNRGGDRDSHCVLVVVLAPIGSIESAKTRFQRQLDRRLRLAFFPRCSLDQLRQRPEVDVVQNVAHEHLSRPTIDQLSAGRNSRTIAGESTSLRHAGGRPSNNREKPQERTCYFDFFFFGDAFLGDVAAGAIRNRRAADGRMIGGAAVRGSLSNRANGTRCN